MMGFAITREERVITLPILHLPRSTHPSLTKSSSPDVCVLFALAIRCPAIRCRPGSYETVCTEGEHRKRVHASDDARWTPYGEFDASELKRSEIRALRFRHREQVVAEAVAVVLGADELLPRASLLAPARGHIHGFVERVLVLD